jgi:SSS family solute:Na+ symporter
LIAPADWSVIVLLLAFSLGLGLWLSRRQSTGGLTGYFAAGRKLPWWAIGLSNTATYQSGAGGFVMLILSFGLVGNWLWWASWLIWMPLVAIIWAPLWRRLQITTTAELITVRYGGKKAIVARKAYAALSCFGFSVLLIGYITGFFVKTLAPIIKVNEVQVLLVLGGITVIYTLFGGLRGVVYVDVLQFGFLMTGSFLFLYFAVHQNGGITEVLNRIRDTGPDALQPFPPSESFPLPLLLILILQGFFFAGSPTAGEGSTAQRFMAARSDSEAMKGQLFNTFLSLSFRVIPLIGIGLVALSLFRTHPLDDPVHAWATVLNLTKLPPGLKGLLIGVEVAAYLSTLSTLINWGSSFVVNDLLPKRMLRTPQQEVAVSRVTTLVLFLAAGVVASLFVDNMVSWFVFINSAMVIFLLPLAWFRFFWWRFNAWGELAAIILGLPLSIFVWFILDYQNKSMWQGLAILFGLSFVVLVGITLLTKPERQEVLETFYRRCRPPGLWMKVRRQMEGDVPGRANPAMVEKSIYGILAGLGLVIFTAVIFTGPSWLMVAGILMALVFGWMLVRKMKLS